MPQYELMYIVSSAVADDQVPAVSSQVLQFIGDGGGTVINETQLGKKKLAYPIKKTRNAFYVAVTFNMPAPALNAFDAKIRTQTGTIVRYLIINQDEHLERLGKDAILQAKLSKQPVVEPGSEPVRATSPKTPAKPVAPMNEEELEKKIEEALTEDITK